MSDLLQQKTKEFENLPANILGLDSWVLRALAKDQRNSFLKGYRKLLLANYHPDQIQSPEGKRAREKYLQLVAEAVDWMASRPEHFEQALETVPTRQNWAMRLKNEVHLVNEGAETVRRELEVKYRELTLAWGEEQKAKEALSVQKENLAHLVNSLTRVWREACTGFRKGSPVIPKQCRVLGGKWLEFGGWTSQTQFVPTEHLLAWVNGAEPAINARYRWRNQFVAACSGIMSVKERYLMHQRASKLRHPNRTHYVIGSIGMAALIELLRNKLDYKPATMASLQTVLRSLGDPHPKLSGKTRLEDYIRPWLQLSSIAVFWCPKLVEHTGIGSPPRTSPATYRFLWITEVGK